LDFLRRIHERSLTGKDDYSDLLKAKRILKAESLHAWGVCKCYLTGEWIVPGYNGDGNLSQLYRYVYDKPKDRWVFMATPKLHSEEYEISQGLFGGHLFDGNKQDVHLAEGLWDGIADWEVVGSKVNVVATPGCRTFFESWVPRYFKGRRVSILFDNDHPKLNSQTRMIEEPTAYSATKRVAGVLKGVLSSNRPESVRYLKWGQDGYDEHLPDGHDVRDVLATPFPQNNGSIVPLKEREERLRNLLGRLEVAPDSWPAVKLGSEELTPLPCTSWDDLLEAWEKAMDMTDGLRKGLAVLMACVVSTNMVGEQIWVRLMGPASSGKTTLCEAMTIAKKYVKAVSVFTGFHSGYRSDKDGEEDHSLIPQVRDKTFIIKDGDTLLQSPNRERIMAELRDVYDGASRAHYRHGVNRDYEGLRVTVVVAGTSTLRQMDAAEFGGRFIDCVVMEMKRVPIKKETETVKKLVRAAWKYGRQEYNGKAEKRDGTEKIKAKRLTGGYVIHLRENSRRLVDKVRTPDYNDEKIANYARFVAYMRARPSQVQDEIAEREFSARLGIQYGRLAQYLAVAMGKSTIDSDVMGMVREVVLDTCQGKTLDVCRPLYNAGEQGLSFGSLQAKFNGKEAEVKAYINYLNKIEVIEMFEFRPQAMMQAQQRWRLRQDVKELYASIVVGTHVEHSS
jgi:hypothetical protein